MKQAVLEDSTPDVTTSNVVADLKTGWLEGPFLLAVESGQSHATRDVDAVRGLRDGFERTLDSVVDGFHQTGAQFDGQRFAGPDNGVTDGNTGCDNGQKGILKAIQMGSIAEACIPVSS